MRTSGGGWTLQRTSDLPPPLEPCATGKTRGPAEVRFGFGSSGTSASHLETSAKACSKWSASASPFREIAGVHRKVASLTVASVSFPNPSSIPSPMSTKMHHFSVLASSLMASTNLTAPVACRDQYSPPRSAFGSTRCPVTVDIMGSVAHPAAPIFSRSREDCSRMASIFVASFEATASMRTEWSACVVRTLRALTLGSARPASLLRFSSWRTTSETAA
mmetsp:Transcript_13942/g.44015  ORF Transcript_13942/g.44015 Transcript_13942/m.44015 type:complete len:219 (+) Transcript_13942:1535-2191(+)